MPLTPVAGITRLRAFQLGKETTFKTKVDATRRMPWSFAPQVDPHWTFPTADTGTLSQALPPYPTAVDVTGTATGQAYSNDMPTLWAALLKGGVTPTGSGTYIWTYEPDDDSQDAWDTFSGEWFDDATGDAYGAVGGIVEQATLAFPQDQGPITISANWRFAKVTYGITPTADLGVDAAPVPLFAADTALYIDDASGDIGVTQLVDTMYDASVLINNSVDVKRFSNGSNARFEVDNYGRGERIVTATFTFAKSSAAIAEAALWLASSPTERFVSLQTNSPVSPHAQRIRFGGFWTTNAPATINTNTGLTLTCHARYNASGLGYPISVVATNTRATL